MKYMPLQASTFAEDWDLVWNFVLWASIISCVILIGGLIFFVVKYQRRSDNDKTAYITHNTLAEFLWSFIPLVTFMAIAAWGWEVYKDMRTFPNDAVEINVTGQKWVWNMMYTNGRVLTNELVVPAGKPVIIHLTSKDVLHSFYIPSFRVKQDAVPGRRSKLWFQSDREGEYHLFCTEYCGTNHSGMLGKVRVIASADFDAFMKEDPNAAASPVEMGKRLYQQQACIGCHTLDGKPLVGPSFKGIFGRTENIKGGGAVTADENYIRESILTPAAKIVEGFPENQMPVYQGVLNEDQITAIIEFLKTIK